MHAEWNVGRGLLCSWWVVGWVGMSLGLCLRFASCCCTCCLGGTSTFFFGPLGWCCGVVVLTLSVDATAKVSLSLACKDVFFFC